jgi:hypothetical protein
MLLLGLLSLIIGGGALGVNADSAGGTPPVRDTVRLVAQRDSVLTRLVVTAADTPRTRPRPRAVEVSEWYSRRLTIHRYVAYATLPVFALEYAAGDQLYRKSRDAPTWAKTTHRVGATALAGMFTVNTVTGVWNWWDSRSISQGRELRTIHALSMLGADAAFTYAGAKLANEAETSSDKRRLHRTIALSAIGVTVASGVAMKLWNR